jgi:hypothetical protein
MDTVPYHPKLWKAYHDSAYTTSSSLDSSSSSSSSIIISVIMEYLYLYIAFFIGVFITIISINVMNICMRPVVNEEVMSKTL